VARTKRPYEKQKAHLNGQQSLMEVGELGLEAVE